MKKYNPRKCQRIVAATFKDAYGNTTSLFKHHSFDWAIAQDKDGKMTITMLPREEAKKKFHKLKRDFGVKKK